MRFVHGDTVGDGLVTNRVTNYLALRYHFPIRFRLVLPVWATSQYSKSEFTSCHIYITCTFPPPKLSVSPFRPAWRGDLRGVKGQRGGQGLPRWLGSCSAFTWADGASARADAGASKLMQYFLNFDASRNGPCIAPIRALRSYPRRFTLVISYRIRRSRKIVEHWLSPHCQVNWAQ